MTLSDWLWGGCLALTVFVGPWLVLHYLTRRLRNDPRPNGKTIDDWILRGGKKDGSS